MNPIRNRFVKDALQGCLAIVAMLVLAPGPLYAQPPTQGAPVHIVNPLPIPVTGVVTIGPDNTVRIVNPASSPVPIRDVDVAARQPFQIGTVFHILAAGGGEIPLTTVPAGSNLVIEHVSAFYNVSTADGLSNVQLNAGSFPQSDSVACQRTGSAPNGLNYFFSCSAQTKLYVGSGQDVSITAFTAGSAASLSGRAFISGYLVPAP